MVVARGPAGFLGPCLDGILASDHRRLDVLVVADPEDPRAAEAVRSCPQVRSGRVRAPAPAGDDGWLDAAIRRAEGDYLCFVDADDEVPREAYAFLVAELERTGSDLAVGGGDEHRDRQTLRTCPDVLARTTLTQVMFRTAFWRTAGLTLPAWHRGPVTLVAAYLAAAGFDVLAEEVYRRLPRDVSLPVDEQERFRTETAVHLAGALQDVDGLLARHDPVLRRAWLTRTLTHTLPPSCTDAIGGGERFLQALSPVVRHLVDEAGPALAEVPVDARLCAWVAAHRPWEELALVLDLLADQPHGLQVEPAVSGQLLVRLPGQLGDVVPAAVARIEEVDRRFRSQVSRVLRRDDGDLVVDGAAFVEYADGLPDLAVTLVGPGGTTALRVTPRTDPEVNRWAQRAFEDRSSAGFRATATREDLGDGNDGPWQVVLTADGRSARHPVALPTPPPHDAVTAVDARLDGDTLRIHLRVPGDRAPHRMAARGGRGEVADVAVRAPAAPADPWVADLPLRTALFGESVLLPAGRYALELVDGAGRDLPVSWAPELLAAPPALVGHRLRVDLHRGPAGGAVLGVAPGVRPEERSAFDQQRLLSSVYAAPPAASSDRPTVLLETFRGRSVGDNPGAIGAELLARDLGLDLAWVVDDPSVNVPAGTRAVQRRTEEWYAALAGARAYVGNAGAPYWFEKKPGQLHVQTWHGTPLKRIGEDRGPGDFSTWRHRRRIAAQAAGWDALISPSPFCSGIFPSAFRYDGDLLEVGYPRNDVLLTGGDVRDRVRSALGLGDDVRAVLYAPTWREYVGVRDAKPLYLDAERLTARLPGSVVLVRGHYNSTTQADVFRDHPRILDVTRYPDIADLFLAADVLVTDYSSVMFDFALTDKPMVLLTPDLEQYRDVERGFYFDFESRAPGPVVTTTDEVVAVLDGPDRHQRARATFRDEFCPWDDGGAARRTADWLLARL